MRTTDGDGSSSSSRSFPCYSFDTDAIRRTSQNGVETFETGYESSMLQSTTQMKVKKLDSTVRSWIAHLACIWMIVRS